MRFMEQRLYNASALAPPTGRRNGIHRAMRVARHPVVDLLQQAARDIAISAYQGVPAHSLDRASVQVRRSGLGFV
ncbi:MULTISPECIES: hypothetical protein [unclassified Chelatococcus]|uniref:hypothetical protein n=1 Tax=unclassified Chelatococcus TaxID=2638111 RepID=UPI001BCF8C70|nr:MULTISPECIES: hypothetical protein [unclassified Chelatococcus]MBS7740895.1 hypothetical protein [Chelatococcus sp. HY11]MBX3546814.1 hypothetical protein [Chelatococcus sp.]